MHKLIVIAGPSGVGKTTVCKKLLESEDFERVITATTRNPRNHEVNGTDYHFFTDEEFQQKIENNDFLEYARVYDKYYGTPKTSVEEILNKNKHALLIVDIQGSESIRNMNLGYVQTYFILPPSLEELEKRLRERKSDSEENILKRLNRAKNEIEHKVHFDYNIINDDIESVITKIKESLR